MPRKPDEHDLFARVPKPLWKALNEEADREQRSATAQLIVILRQRYPGAEGRGKRGGRKAVGPESS